jgi:hypothetical protein
MILGTHAMSTWFCLQNRYDTSLETLYTKNADNKLSFPLVNHIAYFNTRFGRYGLLKSGYGADQVLDRLGIQVIGQALGPKEAQLLLGFEQEF